MQFQILSLGILLGFYGCYFGKMLLQRRAGIQTNQLGKGKTGFPKFIEQMLSVFSICMPAAELVSIFFFVPLLPAFFRYLGAVLGIWGTVIFLCSVTDMKDSWRAGVCQIEKPELITTGIYRFSRNPAFLGFYLVYFGVLLMFFRWWLFLCTILTVSLFHLQIVKVEEPFLLSVFGDGYLAYQNTVHRYWGRKQSS